MLHGLLETRPPWIQRPFNLAADPTLAAESIERLAGAPPRVEELVRGLDDDTLAAHPDRGWSIKQNIGHLSDLEPLWRDRLRDLLTGRPNLTDADVSNPVTNSAPHDTTPITELTARFRAHRESLCNALWAVAPEDFANRAAHHNRLNKTFRLIDHLEFIAIHDDYHLARIRALRAAT